MGVHRPAAIRTATNTCTSQPCFVSFFGLPIDRRERGSRKIKCHSVTFARGFLATCEIGGCGARGGPEHPHHTLRIALRQHVDEYPHGDG